jgi:MinD superfamily P-loop ATPase
LPVLLTIPFDRRIAEAYSRGETMVEALPEWEPKFLRLFADIAAIIERGAAQ